MMVIPLPLSLMLLKVLVIITMTKVKMKMTMKRKMILKIQQQPVLLLLLYQTHVILMMLMMIYLINLEVILDQNMLIHQMMMTMIPMRMPNELRFRIKNDERKNRKEIRRMVSQEEVMLVMMEQLPVLQ